MQLDVAVVALAYISRVLGANDTEVFGPSSRACNSHTEIALDANFKRCKLSLSFFYLCSA
jgi:hypothetical protein